MGLVGTRHTASTPWKHDSKPLHIDRTKQAQHNTVPSIPIRSANGHSSNYPYLHSHSATLFIQPPHAPLLTRFFRCIKASISSSNSSFFFYGFHRLRNQSNRNTSSPSNSFPLLVIIYIRNLILCLGIFRSWKGKKQEQQLVGLSCVLWFLDIERWY